MAWFYTYSKFTFELNPEQQNQVIKNTTTVNPDDKGKISGGDQDIYNELEDPENADPDQAKELQEENEFIPDRDCTPNGCSKGPLSGDSPTSSEDRNLGKTEIDREHTEITSDMQKKIFDSVSKDKKDRLDEMKKLVP
mmetsp:Transcript_3399/g.5734  ORF Transcript_3399/g.5734 Transcript_3399/m.5734 type:complete len:138 (+) Transcript_3399:344-757(+)|eukprot:CAMPEP_0168613724 /NCGR_PEP_ID=MMETSP0449_2-20121227/3601_1 /TAXON_ID=1082188 /ORGANISM="Strombidium rassoulzadegani, Strain ras09" /LENGTH=137 /DNA_ID=CAMNT_0008654371 /DNA_START=326 /DNA_END=739 /DNA_ORIENTATION=-